MEIPVWAAVAVAYLIGSIDFAIFVARLHGVDIRSEGSGNPGTANVFRVVGVVPGILVLVGDLLKGVVAAYLGWLAAGSVDPVGSWAVMLAGTAAVIGHCYPIFHKFQGGKGMATLFGAMLFILPLVTVVMAVCGGWWPGWRSSPRPDPARWPWPTCRSGTGEAWSFRRCHGCCWPCC